MTKEESILVYKKMLSLDNVSKEFKQMAFVPDEKPCYGWRTLTIKEGERWAYLTLEKNPNGFSVYNNEIRYHLSNEIGIELLELFDHVIFPDNSLLSSLAR
jgi:hypothetical protein